MSHRPTRRSVVAGLSSVLGIGAASAVLGRRGKSDDRHRPNIVFFLGEGLRTDEFSIAGNPILKTPNMDRIGREGVIFSNAFVTNALCLPSRASILSGAYSHATGATTNQEDEVPSNFPMFTDVLRQYGYQAAFIGKSHVGGALMDRPWDYYFGFKGQADYLHPTIIEGRGGVYGEPKIYDRYVDDLLTEKAIAWINTRGDEPFCLLLWFYAPHAPFYRPRRLLDLFNGIRIPVPENFNDDLANYKGKSRAVAEAENKIGTTEVGDDDPRSLEELVKDHYAGVESNDEDVGRLLDAMASGGKLDDTAIMLSSDHGFFLGEHTFYDKRLMYEPAIRVPMMIRWPNRIHAGQVRDEMVLNIDVAETLLEIAGLPIPATMQGRSFLGLALGKSVSDWRKDWLYEYYEYPGFENVRPHRGIRTERYKLIHFFIEPQEFELYDLQTDSSEDKNLYDQPGYETLTAQLKSRLEELRRETADQYQYKPSMIVHRELHLVPPEPQRPWRPNGS